jgi:hypothetical protein
MLVFGATGRTGLLVVKKALAEDWNVFAFVRSPERFPIGLRKRVTMIQGDLNNDADVAGAIRRAKPNSIIDASSALPFGHESGRPPNNADRAVFARCVADTLTSENMLDSCVFLIVGGILLPEPGGTILGYVPRFLACFFSCLLRGEWTRTRHFLQWMFEESNPNFKFIYARMGPLLDQPHRGALMVRSTRDGVAPDSVSYCDLADSLVSLSDPAHGKPWYRQAIYFNYAATPSAN